MAPQDGRRDKQDTGKTSSTLNHNSRSRCLRLSVGSVAAVADLKCWRNGIAVGSGSCGGGGPK